MVEDDRRKLSQGMFYQRFLVSFDLIQEETHLQFHAGRRGSAHYYGC